MASLILLGLLFAILAFTGGQKYRDLKDKLNALEEIVKENNDLASAPTFIDVSPKAANKRLHDSKRKDEDSAVVNIKTPQQLRQEKEAEGNSILDSFTGKS